MTEYTASNGITVKVATDRISGNVYLVGSSPLFGAPDNRVTEATASAEGIDALRGFFQAERDAELGRWRWPENPDYVVYPPIRDREKIAVVNEATGNQAQYSRNSPTFAGPIWTAGGPISDWTRVARAYFDAHPNDKPLPDVDGIYAVSPRVHPYERLIQRRNGEWIHLRRSAGEFNELVTAQTIAQSAANEGRLTRLVPEVEPT